jgi:hypothetical protein
MTTMHYVLLLLTWPALLFLVWLAFAIAYLVVRRWRPHHPFAEVAKFGQLRRRCRSEACGRPQFSYAVPAAYLLSLLFRLTSPLQQLKTLFKAASDRSRRGGRKSDDVPPWVVEMYVAFWVAYALVVGVLLPGAPAWLRDVLAVVLVYRIAHVVHGSLYYGCLRAVYWGPHRVHDIGRNIILLCVSYLELGILFADVYLVLGSQFSAPHSHAGITSLACALYYSAATITTLGYGDITPICDTSRLLSASEALSGVAFLALGVSRLVALLPSPLEGSRSPRPRGRGRFRNR